MHPTKSIPEKRNSTCRHPKRYTALRLTAIQEPRCFPQDLLLPTVMNTRPRRHCSLTCKFQRNRMSQSGAALAYPVTIAFRPSRFMLFLRASVLLQGLPDSRKRRTSHSAAFALPATEYAAVSHFNKAVDSIRRQIQESFFPSHRMINLC